MGVRFRPRNQSVPISASSTTMNVAIPEPNHSTAEKRNTSETDGRALMEGILRVREQVTIVKQPTRANPLTGAELDTINTRALGQSRPRPRRQRTKALMA